MIMYKPAQILFTAHPAASIIMRNSSIIQRESDGNVEVCAQLSSPIEREVTVEMSSATLDLAGTLSLYY